MKAYRISTLLKLAFLLAIGARTTMLLVSSYTFDPLNNSWKPSARQKKQRRNIRPGSSFSENSYAPSKSTPSPGVQFTYDEQDIVRHHYTAFGIGTNGEQQTNDPAFVPKASLVEIQYNKKTGEVSLLDEAGVVTPEEYKRIVKAVKYANEEGADGSNGNAAFEQELQSQEREEGVAVGTTLYIDPEDLDPTEIIDVEDDSSDYSSSRQETPIGYHQSESVSSSETSPSTTTAHATQTAHASHAETFDSYTIAQPATVTNPSQPTASAAGYTNVQQPQQPQQHQDYQYAQQHVQTVAAVATEPTAHDYQYAQQHVQTTTAVPTEPTVEQYYQQQQQQQIGYSYDYQAYYEPTTVTEQLDNEQGVEETYYDDGTYRKSRGFGFAHRRESFTGTEYEY